MSKRTVILTTGTGKNKREWELTKKEFEEFELMFEENELIEMPEDFSGWNITLVEPPTGMFK